MWNIVCSKTRVSPVQDLTVPRLELVSALLLSRLIVSVTKSFEGVINLQPSTMFLQPRVAVYWICRSDKSWQHLYRTVSMKSDDRYHLKDGDIALELTIQQMLHQGVRHFLS